MKESKQLDLLHSKAELNSSLENSAIGIRDGTPIEKGVTLNEQYLTEHEQDLRKAFQFFTAYPDLFIDLITPEGEGISLFFYQRIFLRAVMRFKDIYLTAARAFSKSFLTILGLMLQCIFIPGRRVFICAPQKKQGAQIAKEKILEIYKHWPLIKREVVGWEINENPGCFGNDYVTIRFINDSQFDVVGALESTLGGRRHGGLIDEIKNHDEETINTIVLPLMNVSRRLPSNTVNPKEPNQQVISATSAWAKTSFAYDKLIDTFEYSIINPMDAFCMGCDYRVPMLHGLISRDYINKLKLSPSFNVTTFATEYLSIWQGDNGESWFNFEKIAKYRKIKNPEKRAKNCIGERNQFYILSVDVGRLNDQTIVCAFRVNVNEQGIHYATLVNLYVLARQGQTKSFTQQAIEIKRLINAFQPRQVIIDTNGLGVGLGDEMIKPQTDELGIQYPSYGFTNDNDYLAMQPADAIKILYGMKANGPLNSKIHGNVYARLSSGLVRLLISEQEAKNLLLATKVGQKMTAQERQLRLLPHEQTTRLLDEMANLRLKKTGVSTDIVLEQINPRYPKDKYSAFAYGLWLIKELEEEYTTKRRRRFGDGSTERRYTFFN